MDGDQSPTGPASPDKAPASLPPDSAVDPASVSEGSSSGPELPTDSRASLDEFRRQAGPIVAQARGLTSGARVKLARLAEQLKLPDDQFEQALRSLNERGTAPALDANAEKFRRRLTKDLEGKSGTILGPKHEASILDVARSRYGVDDATARQLLAEVTAELGLQRISSDEAARHVAASVQQAVGDQTWIAREARERLHAAGLNWSLGSAVVDELIEDQLNANREASQRSQRLWRRALVATVSAALLTLSVVLVFVYRTPRSEVPAIATPNDGDVESGALGAGDSTATTISPPSWWRADLAADMHHARTQFESFDALRPMLMSAKPEQRATAYRQLLAGLTASSTLPADLDLVRDIVTVCYHLEPDDIAAHGIRDGLIQFLPAGDSPLPDDENAYTLAYWGVETACQIIQVTGERSERSALLAKELAVRCGVAFDPKLSTAQSRKTLLAGLTTLLYRQLIRNAAKQPETVAALQPYVGKQAARHLVAVEKQRLEARFLLAALSQEAASETVETTEPMQQLLISTSASQDPQATLTLIELYERMPNSPLRDELQGLLMLRFKLTSPPESPSGLARELRRAMGVAPTGNAALLERWQALRQRAAEALNRPEPAASDYPGQLTASVELAWLASQALALSHGDSGLAIFDELTAQMAEGGLELKLDPEAALPLPPPMRAAGGLSKLEQQAFDRAVAYLGNTNTRQVERESALRGIAQLAPRVPDVSQAQARVLMLYFFVAKTEAEQAEILKSAAELRHWKLLRLAVADALLSTNAPLAGAQPLVSALVGRGVSTAATDLTGLRLLLLESVVRDLTPATTASHAGSPELWDAAAASLAEAYRVRARLLAVPPAEYQAAPLPSQVLAACVRRVAGSLPSSGVRNVAANMAEQTGWPVPVVDRWNKELLVADYLASGDMGRTVLLEGMLFRLAAEGFDGAASERGTDLRQLVAAAAAEQGAAANALVQLRRAEANLLKLWLLHAPEDA